MKSRSKPTLLKLFTSTLYLSAFTFGGGYVIITLLKDRFVDRYHWISEEEMLDLTAIAQSSPGAVAVNGAAMVGYRLAGIRGALACVLGAVLPPMVILSLVSMFYRAFVSNPWAASMLGGMKAGVGAVIVSVVWDMGSGIVRAKDMLGIGILLLGFFAGSFLGVNVICILLAAGALGALRAFFTGKAGETS